MWVNGLSFESIPLLIPLLVISPHRYLFFLCYSEILFQDSVSVAWELSGNRLSIFPYFTSSWTGDEAFIETYTYNQSGMVGDDI